MPTNNVRRWTAILVAIVCLAPLLAPEPAEAPTADVVAAADVRLHVEVEAEASLGVGVRVAVVLLLVAVVVPVAPRRRRPTVP